MIIIILIDVSPTMSIVSLIKTACVWSKWFFSWYFCWFWLEFFSHFFRLVGFWLLITTPSLQHFSPKVWADSFSVDETLEVEVACLTDFSILELCFSSPSLHWLCQQAHIWQHFVFINWRTIFHIWSLKFKGRYFTLRNFPLQIATSCAVF